MHFRILYFSFFFLQLFLLSFHIRYKIPNRHSDISICNVPEDTLNIVNFGAKGNRITDDAIAFQKAILQAVETNKAIKIPAGTWYWKSTPELPVNIKGKLKIIGEKNATIVLINAQFTKISSFAKSYSYVQNIDISNLNINAARMNVSGHCIIGNRTEGKDIFRLNWKNINISDIAVDSLPVPKKAEKAVFGILIQSLRSISDTQEVKTHIFNVSINDVHIKGGSHGILILGHKSGGGEANVFTDKVSVFDCSHKMDQAASFIYSTGLHLGGSGLSGEVLVSGFSCFGQGDNGIEINNFKNAIIENCSIVRPFVAGITIKNTRALAYINEQSIVIRNCNFTLKDKGQSMAFLMSSDDSTKVLGNCTIEKCKVFKSNDRTFNQQGLFINTPGRKTTSFKLLVIRDCNINWDINTKDNSLKNPFIFRFNSGVKSRIIFKRVRIEITGSSLNSVKPDLTDLNIIGFNGGVIFDVDDLVVNSSVKSGRMTLLRLGGYKYSERTSPSGSLANIKINTASGRNRLFYIYNEKVSFNKGENITIDKSTLQNQKKWKLFDFDSPLGKSKDFESHFIFSN